ncbi:MAG TPA: peptidoglycan editing factor PgeF [candidate division Zixibacteria bacterium]
MRVNDFTVRTTQSLSWLTFPLLEKHNMVLHGFTTRKHPASFEQNINPDHLIRKITRIRRPVISLRQVHQDECVVITSKDKLRKDYRGDAVLTDRKDIFISIQVADCVPIFMLDEKKKVIGLIHAGWKGTLLGIAKRTIETAKEQLGCEPEDFTVWFGPSIRSCCYRVSDDVAILFDDKCVHSSPPRGATLDLVRINRKQLAGCGVKDNRMFATVSCTCCEEKLFYSYRREKENTGRMVGFLGLK